MEKGDKGLEKKVNKILWTHNVINLGELSTLKRGIIESCQKLEDQGFGLLEDSNNPGKIDSSYSVVCPDGSVFTEKQINDYWTERKGRFNSQNLQDMKMYKVNIYCSGFKEEF